MKPKRTSSVSLKSKRISDCDCSIEVESRQQGRVLKTLLAINAAMFVIELVTGILAESTGLIADSLDMLADAVVYGIGLYAVGRTASAKIRAAFTSGYFQIVLALIVALDVSRRTVFGSDPEPTYMMLIGLIALAANIVCLTLDRQAPRRWCAHESELDLLEE